ncbi:DUF916 domain-containing protein [Sphaerisporangium sp. B11E5]|uniref:WxL protein peptidoglycan domain-containing protein n=1 Tax=Sphaerisporangium sp. B11E5 TaxID=3153563 RepID=UPI00325F3615
MRPSQAWLRRPAGLVAPAVLTLLVCAGTALPAHAGDDAKDGLFALTPSSAGPQRPYFDLIAPPGRTARDTVIVSNETSTTQRLRISVSNGVTAANSGSAYRSVPGRCTGVSCWVTGLPATVTLAPGERRALSFRVSVPAGTPPAQYLSGITAQSAAPPATVAAGSNGRASAKAVIVRQVTVGVAVTAGTLTQMRTALTLWRVSAGWTGSRPRLFIPVYNSGQTFARARGTVSCGPHGGHGRHRTYDVVVNTVLPGGGAVLPVNAPGLRAGTLACAVRLRDAAGRPVTWTGDVELRSPSREETARTGEGDFMSLPLGTVPTWAIVLMILGTLTLAALVVLIVLRRRQPRI